MDAPWHIRLLGTLEAKQGDLVLSRFATSRVAALLARLALFPSRTHSREELAGLLWPEADEHAGRLNLRVALASLRRQMEPPASHAGSIFVAEKHSLRLYPDSLVSDASQFESLLRDAARTPDPLRKRDALAQAVALHSGELLPGFYDEWVLDERERLLALCEDAERQCRSLSPASAPAESPPVAVTTRPAPPSATASPAPALLGFPGRFTRFFGRTREQARLQELLADPEVRLVTLLGPGGAGKTRLAAEAARSAALSSEAGFDGPVCFVPLADTGDSALLPAAAAAALRLPLSGERSAREQVAAHLGEARVLLVLDNLEHLGAGGAEEIRALLDSVPRLVCLVTSRQTLSLEGEHEMPLAPLPVPAADAPEPPAHLSVYSGVQLFVDRAQAVRPDFQITDRNADAVAAVCRALEGLPLALELAAARIQALTPHQMQTQLQSRLSFLTSRRRDLPPRHRSLRAALEWSAHLLTPEQTRFFSCLSVFRGGWTADAAGAVGKVPDPLVLLEELCERSLISAEETALGMRFRILESLREFGEEQLTPEEKTGLGRRHAVYFQELAGAMEALWVGPKQKASAEVLDAEGDNLRAALLFCRGDAKSGETGMRLAGSLQNYWILRGLLREGRDWMQGALAGTGSGEARGKLLTNAGWMQAVLGDPAAAMRVLDEAVALNRQCGSDKWLAQALRSRGVAAIWQGDLASAMADSEEALAISRRIGDEYGAALTLNNLAGFVNEHGGDKRRAVALHEEALELFLKLDVPQRAVTCLYNLGAVTYDLGDLDRAAALLRESLALAASQDNLLQRSYGLKALGDVLREQGDLPGAESAQEESLLLARRVGDRVAEGGALTGLAQTRRMQKDYTGASALACAALRLYESMGHPLGRTQSWLNLAETAAAQEQWEDAAACFSAAEACGVYDVEDPDFAAQEPFRDLLRTKLSPAGFEAAFARGRTLTCNEYGLH